MSGAPAYTPLIRDGAAPEKALPMHPRPISVLLPVGHGISEDYAEGCHASELPAPPSSLSYSVPSWGAATFNTSCIPQRHCYVDTTDLLSHVCLLILNSARETRNRGGGGRAPTGVQDDRFGRVACESHADGCACRCEEVACSNAEALVRASSLPEDAIVAVDLEGRSLGRDGSICIVTLATISCVYIIDIVRLGPGALQPASSLLRKILESNRITKLMFDCRADCDALYHIYNVRMRHVCDLQVAACSTGRFGRKWLPSLTQVLSKLQLITNTDEAIKEAGKKFFDPSKGGSYSNWERRPLMNSLREYCFVDVKYFFRLRTLLYKHLIFACSMAEKRVQYVCSGRYNAQDRINCLSDIELIDWSRSYIPNSICPS